MERSAQRACSQFAFPAQSTRSTSKRLSPTLRQCMRTLARITSRGSRERGSRERSRKRRKRGDSRPQEPTSTSESVNAPLRLLPSSLARNLASSKNPVTMQFRSPLLADLSRAPDLASTTFYDRHDCSCCNWTLIVENGRASFERRIPSNALSTQHDRQRCQIRTTWERRSVMSHLSAPRRETDAVDFQWSRFRCSLVRETVRRYSLQLADRSADPDGVCRR